MELATVGHEMSRLEARRAYLDLRAEIRATRDEELTEAQARHRALDEAAAQAYRQLSLGRQLIRLGDTILGGFDGAGRPRMAILRADKDEVLVRRWQSGAIRYTPSDDSFTRAASLMIRFDGPPAEAIIPEAVATAPSIPPQHRPRALHRYHVLWEAEWRSPRTARRAPRDPALLRHLRGDLWAVLAVWDLTPIEQAVLEGARIE